MRQQGIVKKGMHGLCMLLRRAYYNKTLVTQAFCPMHLVQPGNKALIIWQSWPEGSETYLAWP